MTSGVYQKFKLGLILKLIQQYYHINKLKMQNHMIITINAEKALDKVQYPFLFFPIFFIVV